MYFSNEDDGDALNVLLCIGVIIGAGTSAEIGLHLPDWATRVGEGVWKLIWKFIEKFIWKLI